jgi:hypothetical protein
MAEAAVADLDGATPPTAVNVTPRRPAPTVDVSTLLRQGLGELVSHWRHDDNARWHEHVGPLLEELAGLAFGTGPAVTAKLADTAEFLRRHGRAEMVPEAVMRLAHTPQSIDATNVVE